MSFVRKAASPPPAVCSCLHNRPGGTFRLSIEPQQVDVRAHAKHDYNGQLINAERVQAQFIPHLAEADAHEFSDGYHVHPDQPLSVAHIEQLHPLMEQYGLCARVSMSRGHDHPAVTAELTSSHVDDLIKNGIADVKVPISNDTFRLHSNRPGRITAVEFVSSSD